MTIISQVKNEILPINMPQNNEYSWKSGSSLIQILIPQAPTVLLTKTLKLNGKLRLNQGASTFSTPVFANNLNRVTAGAPGPFTLRLNERVGMNSLFQNITISGLGSGGQTLEQVRQVGRLLAVTNPLLHEQGEFDGYMNGQDPAVASRELISAVDMNTEVFFSIPIEIGMIQGTDAIPIGVNGTRGLQILIQLENDANALIGAAGVAANANCFYSLIDVSLTYDTIQYDAATSEMMDKATTGQMEYNTWSHQYSVLNASDSQLNLNFGTKNTLAVFSNNIPTTHINNVDFDGFSTDLFKNQTAGVYNTTANLDRLTFGRNGIKLPYDFEFDEAAAAAANRPQVERIDALKGSVNVRNSARTSISVGTENALLTKVNLNGDEVALLNPAVSVETQSKPVFASGTNLDNISHVGRDYSTAVYSVRFETELDGASPNSINTYSLAKNVLTYSPSGISVSS
mgnify:CR=1 FL=1